MERPATGAGRWRIGMRGDGLLIVSIINAIACCALFANNLYERGYLSDLCQWTLSAAAKERFCPTDQNDTVAPGVTTPGVGAQGRSDGPEQL